MKLNPFRFGWLCIILMAASAHSDDLVVMSFNLKGDAAGLSDVWNARTSWSYAFGRGRRERAMAVIRSVSPDILGVQELKENQLADLRKAFPEFSYYGRGRGDRHNDHNGIFYRTNRFERVDQGDFWLSETPGTPNSVFKGSGTDEHNPRMATWVILSDKVTDTRFFVLNTHWSLDAAARLASAELIRERTSSLADGLPLIMLGDLNATEREASYRRLRGEGGASGFQLKDSYRAVHAEREPNERTYHNWGKFGTRGQRIDHILYSADTFVATEARILRDLDEGDRYPSDHFPVTARLRFKTRQD